MQLTKLTVSVTLLIVLLAAPAWGASPTCDEKESFNVCWSRLETGFQVLLNKRAAEKAKEATPTMQAQVQAKSTATALETGDTSLRDTLSTLAAAVGTASDDSTDPIFSFEQQLFRWKLGKYKRLPVSLRVEVKQAELLDALVEEIPKDFREERVELLNKDVGDLDSVDLQLRAALEDAKGKMRFGRDPKDYLDLFGSFFADIEKEVRGDDPRPDTTNWLQWQGEAAAELRGIGLRDVRYLDERIVDLRAKIRKKLELRDNGCLHKCEETKLLYFSTQVGCERHRLTLERSLPEEGSKEWKTLRKELVDCALHETEDVPPLDCESDCRARSKAAREKEISKFIQRGVNLVIAAAAESAAVRSAREQALEHGEFVKLVDLIDNQPQAYFEATRKERGDLSGPDEWTGKLVFEFGLVNVNGFRRWASKTKNKTAECPAGVPGLPSYGCLQAYMDKRKKHLGDGNRFALSVEYSDVEEFTFALPDDGVDFRLEAVEKLIGSLSYGRRLTFNEAGDEMARLDLTYSYEDVSDDPDRQSRSLLKLTLTRKLMDQLSLSLGAVWANKPEFVGEVDEQVTARFGLNWKVSPLAGDDK